MKTTKITIMALFMLSMANIVKADTTRIAVLRIETYGKGLDPFITAQLFRAELKNNPQFDVVDKATMTETLSEKKLDYLHFSTDETKYLAGDALACKNVITGTIDAKNNQYYFSIKLFNVKSRMVEHTIFKQFPLEPENFEVFVASAINKLMYLENPNEVVKESGPKQTVAKVKEVGMEPEYTKTSLAGPRLGYTFLTGNTATLYNMPTKEGGYDCNPALFQFGYQFEAQYLANGDYQGLVEFIPTITGMDQSRLFPSITFLNGLRNTRYGIEIALGPTIYVKREAKGYYTQDAVWHLEREWYQNTQGMGYVENPYEIITRVDSRGDVKIASGVVLAVGKSFKSGNLNIPINAYAVPGKNGWRYGISVGFNLKSSKQSYSNQ